MTTTITAEQRQDIRKQFPALAGETVYLENAGGSQVPAVVANTIRDYMLYSYVQLGAGYELSQRCTQLVENTHQFLKLFMNGDDGQVILGSSTSVLLQMLSNCYAKVLKPGQERRKLVEPWWRRLVEVVKQFCQERQCNIGKRAGLAAGFE